MQTDSSCVQVDTTQLVMNTSLMGRTYPACCKHGRLVGYPEGGGELKPPTLILLPVGPRYIA